jgi:hypothetical protein
MAFLFQIGIPVKWSLHLDEGVSNGLKIVLRVVEHKCPQTDGLFAKYDAEIQILVDIRQAEVWSGTFDVGSQVMHYCNGTCILDYWMKLRVRLPQEVPAALQS